MNILQKKNYKKNYFVIYVIVKKNHQNIIKLYHYQIY